MSNSVIDSLTCFLANTFVLYVKTLNFHWNMVGPEFFMYHKLLQEHYEYMSEVSDEIAERVRQLGGKAPGSMQKMLDIATLQEAKEDLDQMSMVQMLVEDHDILKNEGLSLVKKALDHGDEGSADMIVDQVKFHDKAKWLLESHLRS